MGTCARRRTSLIGVIAMLALGAGVVRTAPAPAAGPGTRESLASHDPSGGLVVSVEAGPAATAVVRVLPTAPFASVRIDLASAGTVVLSGPTSAVFEKPAVGREITRTAAYSVTGEDPSTVRLIATALDGGGHPVATASDELYVRLVGDQLLSSTSGPLDLALQATRRRANHRADVDRTLGGGAGNSTTVGRAPTASAPSVAAPAGPSAAQAPGGSVNVAGVIRYNDRNGNPHPVRSAPVEIRDNTGPGTSVVVTTVNTDGAGRYAATVDNAHPGGGGRNIFVRVLARSGGFRILVPGGGGDIQRIDSAPSNNVAGGASLTVDMTANNTDDNNTAFDVHDALVTQVAYTRNLLGAAVPDVDIDFPTAQAGANFSGGVVHLLRFDRFDWDVITHEFTHYFNSTQGIAASPGGPHNIGANLSETNSRTKAQGIPLAFSEGYTSYFAITGQQAMGAAALGIPSAGDTSYTDSENQNFTYDSETQTGVSSAGEDNEASVQRVLWDIRDGAADTGDTRGIGIGDKAVFTTLKAIGAASLSAANAALLNGKTARQVVDQGCILTEHNVAPRITGPADGSLARSFAPPTISWNAQGGGPAHRNNQFIVQFYDTNYALLFASPEQTASSYTPSAATWTSIIGSGPARRSAVNIAIRARQTDAPETGPYTSCNIGLTSDFTPPTSAASTTPPANAAGWNRTDVAVNLNAVDDADGVGVRDITYRATGAQTIAPTAVNGNLASFTVTAEGTTTIAYHAADLEGNAEADKTLVVKIDKTPPANVAFTTDRPTDHNGWYNHPFDATWTGTDALSGIASCTTLTYGGPDTTGGSIPGGCTDVAGNTTTVPLAFRYDGTAPVNVHGVAARPPDSNGWYNHPVTVTFTGDDATSGIDTCTSSTYSGPDTAGVVLAGSCTDKAGNTTAANFALRYDHTPPTTAINRDENLQVLVLVAGAPVTGTATDNLSGVASTAVTFNSPLGLFGSVTRQATCTSGCGTTAAKWSVSTKGLYGVWVVTARSTDVAGNVGPPSPSLVVSITVGL
ncbi:MAG: hypothetical protein M3011_01905 [Actinomycetota bacterium]|nr:hypothetical protein [Actinomycetota bacterium]